MSNRRPQRPGKLLAVPIVSLAIGVAGCGSSNDTESSAAPGARTGTVAVATATAVAARASTTPAPTTTAPTSTTPATTPGSVVTRGSNGRMYHCVGPSLLAGLHTLDRRIDRGRRSLARIRSELRRLKRRYPTKVAPPRVAARYNYLVRKHNALLRLGNRRVSAYNRRLARDCTKG